MTPAPTDVPSRTPTMTPISTIPSALPTITGDVVAIIMSAEVSRSLNEEELGDIVNAAENAFGVNPGKVIADVSYTSSGSLTLTFDDDDSATIDVGVIISALEESIAAALGIHSSEVDVTSFDEDTGVAAYTIQSETAEEAGELRDAMLLSETEDIILSSISESVTSLSSVSFI